MNYTLLWGFFFSGKEKKFSLLFHFFIAVRTILSRRFVVAKNKSFNIIICRIFYCENCFGRKNCREKERNLRYVGLSRGYFFAIHYTWCYLEKIFMM